MKIHFLKTYPEPWHAVQLGLKTAEFRLNDRDYQVGDYLVLQLVDVHEDGTVIKLNRNIFRQVTHILANSFGMPRGYAMLSLHPVEMGSKEFDKLVDALLEQREKEKQVAV